MKRREFIKFTTATAAAATLSPVMQVLAGEKIKKNAHDIVRLGNTGIKASRLAIGTGTGGFNRQSNQTRKLGVPGLADLLRAAYEQGINFWDSADQYGTHPHLKEGLKGIPREKVVILTKTHATTADEMKADLQRFRKEIGTDYLDIVLLHMMTSGDWPMRRRGPMEVLAKARADGVIRAHGVSCHTLAALQTAAQSDWVQVDLARINSAGTQMDADVATVVKVLQKMHQDGKAIVGMKVFGGGWLRDRPDENLKFILDLDCVDAFTIGLESQDEMRDLLQRIPAASVP